MALVGRFGRMRSNTHASKPFPGSKTDGIRITSTVQLEKLNEARLTMEKKHIEAQRVMCGEKHDRLVRRARLDPVYQAINKRLLEILKTDENYGNMVGILKRRGDTHDFYDLEYPRAKNGVGLSDANQEEFKVLSAAKCAFEGEERTGVVLDEKTYLKLAKHLGLKEIVFRKGREVGRGVSKKQNEEMLTAFKSHYGRKP